MARPPPGRDLQGPRRRLRRGRGAGDAVRHVVPAPDIPADPREVNLAALDVGDDEHGNPFRLGLLGKHVFIAGASGAPAGLVRVSMIDLKGGAETARGQSLFARIPATNSPPKRARPRAS